MNTAFSLHGTSTPCRGTTKKNRTVSSLTNLMEPTLTPLAGCPKDGVHLYRSKAKPLHYRNDWEPSPIKRLANTEDPYRTAVLSFFPGLPPSLDQLGLD